MEKVDSKWFICFEASKPKTEIKSKRRQKKERNMKSLQVHALWKINLRQITINDFHWTKTYYNLRQQSIRRDDRNKWLIEKWNQINFSLSAKWNRLCVFAYWVSIPIALATRLTKKSDYIFSNKRRDIKMRWQESNVMKNAFFHDRQLRTLLLMIMNETHSCDFCSRWKQKKMVFSRTPVRLSQ